MGAPADATSAGAIFEPGVTVREAMVGDRGGRPIVGGVLAGDGGHPRRLEARVVIAADGRRSTLAFGLGLARHPAKPRRWAVGAYFDSGDQRLTCGEMHIRRGRYIGVAPLSAGMVNICLVQPAGAGDADFRDPEAPLDRRSARAGAARPLCLEPHAAPAGGAGPLAVEGAGGAIDGLILAGDAAGFVDPMTGDGLRFAIRGGALAASAALDALAHGWDGVQARLAAARRREFAAKLRFNRALRALVASDTALRASAAAAGVLPQLFRSLITRAGDCSLAAP